ncbi:nuclear transport factor 2 family protein [Nocardioides sp. URHA0032]|uniref:nuclear transport factor 2 family protein n=1 Tax=Nocardioides sp. URHA0032 TaxID=1380388 RepID=UPI0004910DCF|nr:nuclear transport factor 2 family protein [Nocardioides sp. URHA0032]
MTASKERIREVVDEYVRLVATGTAAEIAALYAEGATVEDPVGSDVLTGAEAITAFYSGLEGLEQKTRLITLRVAGGGAAFHFEVQTFADGVTYTLAPFDVMAFDDDGKITSMRAYWGDDDMVIG